MEAEYTKLVGNEVQTPKEEGLEWHEDGRTHIPASRSVENSSEPKRIVWLEPAMPKMVERWAI